MGKSEKVAIFCGFFAFKGKEDGIGDRDKKAKHFLDNVQYALDFFMSLC